MCQTLNAKIPGTPVSFMPRHPDELWAWRVNQKDKIEARFEVTVWWLLPSCLSFLVELTTASSVDRNPLSVCFSLHFVLWFATKLEYVKASDAMLNSYIWFGFTYLHLVLVYILFCTEGIYYIQEEMSSYTMMWWYLKQSDEDDPFNPPHLC